MQEHPPPTRLLLPFTHGIEMEALDAAISLAEACHATIVALALLRVKGKRSRQDPRLEHLMEANDFLEAVRWKAARSGVPTEGFQVLTADVGQSLDVLTRQLSCSRMVLFVREGQGVLLSTAAIVGCLHLGNCTCYLLHLEAKHRHQLESLFKRLFSFSFWGVCDQTHPLKSLPPPHWLCHSRSQDMLRTQRKKRWGKLKT
jgi:hypothetical protein